MAKPEKTPATKLHPLEYRVWRRLKALNLAEGPLLVACSGGLDSIALVECLSRVAPRLGCQVEVASVHHGRSAKLGSARARAFALAQSAAERRGLVFHGLSRDQRLKELKSEAELREFRHRALRGVVADRQAIALATAHHADDLYETRLIRLIRGTGPSGLRAMSVFSSGILRPFLEESRASLEAYARERGLEWCEDPSNRETFPLRNWLRHEWLPGLEKKRPGANLAFARSLESLVEALAANGAEDEVAADDGTSSSFALDRARFQKLQRGAQRQQLAMLLRRAGRREFSTAQLDEIRKRLEGRRRKFTLFGLHWCVNAEQITVAPTASAGATELARDP